MKNLIVGTWNIKNSYLLTERNDKKVEAIIELLQENQIHILGLQEVNPILAKKIEDKLQRMNSNYSVTSTYKKGINPIRNLQVEYNLIISNLPHYHSKQSDLPSFPTKVDEFKDITSIRSRNVTCQSFIIGYDTLPFYNTHLDYRDNRLNCSQFNTIYAYLVKEMAADQKMNSILVGNLNKEPDSNNMQYFSEILEAIHLKIVENPKPTYKPDLKTVDYIIVPDSYIVDSVKCIDYYDEKISTHNPVIAKIMK